MCGRFTLGSGPEEISRAFGIPRPTDLVPRYNVAPTQRVAAVRSSGAGRELVFLRWGLIPSWSRDKAIGARLINARGETVAEKPSFRSAFQHRRCLVLADGFYEWKASGKEKQPYYITLRDGGPFALAGLYERWEGDAEVIESCTIITTGANELMRPLHDRMPVILAPCDHGTWLDAQWPTEDLARLLRPYPGDAMRATPVSTRVNSPRNDDAACVEPIEAPGLVLES